MASGSGSTISGAGDGSPTLERRDLWSAGGRKVGGGVGSPGNEDLLYEYFPLSLDDWYVAFFFPFIFDCYLASCVVS